MKKLVLINGTMGAGKTTVCEQLLPLLDAAVYLDGDWCWKMHPFVVNEENKAMVLKNIAFLLRSFLNNSGLNVILFSWVMQQESIVNCSPSRGQRKNIKFFRPAAKRCWPYFMQHSTTHISPSALTRPDCAVLVWYCSNGCIARSSGRVLAC